MYLVTEPETSSGKVGVWLLGALGDIATTMIVGAHGVSKELVSNTGLVSELPPINQLSLAPLDQLIFGGLDILPGSVEQAAEKIANLSRTFTTNLLTEIQEDLRNISANIAIDPQMTWSPTNDKESDPSLGELLARQRTRISEFARKNQLRHVVVVDVTSSEPAFKENSANKTPDGFAQLVSDNCKDSIAPSMLNAYAAALEHCSYINFTPNIGISIEGLQKFASDQGIAFYGNDGKTGETLVKTALAPMFASRNLKVMSWEGTNMLGNGDGKSLSIPANRANKIRNKSNVLDSMLGYTPHSDVSINYVPSLGDWKTAWNFIHFQGFLDVPMSMQFTWQGCDSILAAPLVLDMVRLSELAARHSESGPMKHLACFFKNPMGVDEMALAPQFQSLLEYAYNNIKKHNESEEKRASDP